MSAEPPILVDRPRPGVVVSTLNRPERLNAITPAMFDAMRELREEVERNPDDRVLILTGTGRGFCAGFDLDEAAGLADTAVGDMLVRQAEWAHSITAFRGLSKPVIAAVNGAAAGAGFSLALVADVRVASTTARFSAAFVRLGLSGGDAGTSWLLPRLVGLGHAAEIMLTGRLVDADSAYRMGLVNRVVEPEGLLDECLSLADEMVANSPIGIRLTKQALQTNVDAPSLEAAVAVENRDQVLASRTHDHREALAAFREKRSPRFEAR